MNSPKEYIVSVKNLYHTYLKGTPLEHVALKNTNIEIEKGECVAIIGHTGSGKSTLIQHFNGLIRPETGEVTVAGRNLSNRKMDIKSLRREVGIVFQNPEDQIFESIIGDDIAFGPFKSGLSKKEVSERVKWAMEVVGLDFKEMKDRQTFALSGGQKRKVALAGILALRPSVLVLDEPTAGLDPKSSKEILGKIHMLNKTENMTIIFVSHNMEEVAILAERVFVMADGTVALSGTPKDIFTDSEKLKQYQIGTPDTVKLLYRLEEKGFNVRTDAFSVSEASKEVLRILAE